MLYTTLPDEAARQTIDAMHLWQECAKVRRQCQDFVGGMYWKKEGDYEYLVKTKARGKQERLGRRSADTERIHAEFQKRKAALEPRLKSLEAQLVTAQRLNRAVRAGRGPAVGCPQARAVHGRHGSLGQARAQGAARGGPHV